MYNQLRTVQFYRGEHDQAKLHLFLQMHANNDNWGGQTNVSSIRDWIDVCRFMSHFAAKWYYFEMLTLTRVATFSAGLTKVAILKITEALAHHFRWAKCICQRQPMETTATEHANDYVEHSSLTRTGTGCGSPLQYNWIWNSFHKRCSATKEIHEVIIQLAAIANYKTYNVNCGEVR